jgi:Leucine-rich repeat (LRR) protein
MSFNIYGIMVLSRIEDNNLRRAVEAKMKEQDIKIDREGVLQLNELDVSGMNVENLNGIGLLRNLKKLIIKDNRIIDLSPITELRKLEELYLTRSESVELSCLEGLTELKIIEA